MDRSIRKSSGLRPNAACALWFGNAVAKWRSGEVYRNIGHPGGSRRPKIAQNESNCKRFACPADPSCACACSLEGFKCLKASKMEPRRANNPPPRRSKCLPEASGGVLGARWAPDGHQGRSETASGRLLGRSWGVLGAVLGSLGDWAGSFWPPGGHFFEVSGKLL